MHICDTNYHNHFHVIANFYYEKMKQKKKESQ